MKRTILLALVILSTALFAEKVVLNESAQLFEHTFLNENQTRINFTLDKYIAEDISEGNVTYKRISYPDEGEFAIPGKPDLPNFTRTFAVPNEGEVRIQINSFDEEIVTDIVAFPRRELDLDGEPKNMDFVIDTDYYAQGSIFPELKATVGEPALFRDYRVVTVSVNPFRYDPQRRELRIVKNLELDLICEGRGGVNVKTLDHKISGLFTPMYKSAIENYESILSRNDEFQQPSYLFIYNNSGNVEQYLDYLTLWKKKKGFKVVAASTAETGSTSNSIKNYIQDAYDTWESPPEFICIVGDTAGSFGVPSATSGYEGSDHPYSQLAGNDILADVAIGRLSFDSITQFQTILNKIFSYEMTPYLDETDWFNEVLLVGDPGSSGTSTITTSKNIKETMQDYSNDFNFNEQYSGGFASFINTNINNGVGYFNYRGYIGMSGWSPGGYNNGPMMPNGVIITCGTGSFADGTSTSESFLREGTPTVPKGAVTAIGTATASTHTMFNNCVSMGIFHGIFSEHVFNMGGALVHGKLNLYNTYSSNSPSQTQNFSYWNNLMGDPGMAVWTGIPEELIVTHDGDVAVGTNFLDVNVTDSSGSVLAGAWVTMLGTTDDEVFATGYTDENGNISLALDTSYSENCYLTVTAHDYIPYLGEFSMVTSNSFVNISEFFIDDDNSGDSSGNNDGVVNPGEVIELSVSLENFGTQTADAVTVIVDCEQGFVNITDSQDVYGDIGSGSIVPQPGNFIFSIPEDILGGTSFVLDFEIMSAGRPIWSDHISLTVAGALLSADSYNVQDGNDNVPEPGETFELILEVANLGSTTVNDIEGFLTCSNENIEITDANGTFGDIASGSTTGNTGDTFNVTAGTTIIPGSLISFEVQLTNNTGFDNSITFNVQIGNATITDPVGPDAYGYYAYDDEDTNYYNAPIYNWVEIDPDYGGSGTIIPLNDSGDTGDIEVINLPFNFRMYGQSYSEITVCSNGWIVPGITEDFSFMNWNIPGPGGPAPIIAVFWDDLKMSWGNVCYYYDEPQHRFIVEWSHLTNDYADDTETFQAILYDPNYNPTALGDSEILFQYQEINNTSQGNTDNYPMDHGQYCTIGLEDESGTIGLEYTFNNMYPTAAKHLEDETAILITGPPVTLVEPFIVLGSIIIEDENDNGNVDYGEEIDIGISLNNLGQNAATGVAATISTDDEYITLINEVSSYPDIVGGTSEINSDLYLLEIAENCPNNHEAAFEINVDSAESSWIMYFTLSLHAPVLQYNSIVVDDGENNLLDPGETTDIIVSFANVGGAPAFNVIADISSTDEMVTLNSTSFELGNMNEGNIVSATFNVTADENTEIGHMAAINWMLTGDMNIEASGYFSLSVSQVPVFLEEHFDTFLPADWYIEGGNNWQEGTTNNAGGTPPEAQFYYTNGEGIQRLITMPIVTSGSATLDLEFKHFVSDFSGGYVLRLETSADGENWNTVEEWPAADIPATTENIIIDTPDVGSETFQLAWTYDGNFWNINWWCIDDVYLQSDNPQVLGSIAGNVELTGGTGDITQCDVSVGNYVVHPDNNGNYSISIEPGNYDVTASLFGYTADIASDVEVLPNETSTADFTILFMEIPNNLSAMVTENDVELNWEIPVTLSVSNTDAVLSEKDDIKERKQNIETTTSKQQTRNNRVQTGYKVYRNEELTAEINDIGATTFTDADLENGDYEYYVTSVYENGESEPSNTEEVTIDFVDAGDILIPQVTALTGNHPNPFNPTTNINFQLSEAGFVEIVVYNLRGQKVNTIVKSDMVAGFHTEVWSGRDSFGKSVSSGIYFYEMKTDKYSDVKKMILLK